MVLHFWDGGPTAIKGKYYWRCQRKTALHYELNTPCGCELAQAVGFRIPRDTYSDGDRAVSQNRVFSWATNWTAILPIEE